MHTDGRPEICTYTYIYICIYILYTCIGWSNLIFWVIHVQCRATFSPGTGGVMWMPRMPSTSERRKVMLTSAPPPCWWPLGGDHFYHGAIKGDGKWRWGFATGLHIPAYSRCWGSQSSYRVAASHRVLGPEGPLGCRFCVATTLLHKQVLSVIITAGRCLDEFWWWIAIYSWVCHHISHQTVRCRRPCWKALQPCGTSSTPGGGIFHRKSRR